jgi:hypothetical protein
LIGITAVKPTARGLIPLQKPNRLKPVSHISAAEFIQQLLQNKETSGHFPIPIHHTYSPLPPSADSISALRKALLTSKCYPVMLFQEMAVVYNHILKEGRYIVRHTRSAWFGDQAGRMLHQKGFVLLAGGARAIWESPPVVHFLARHLQNAAPFF